MIWTREDLERRYDEILARGLNPRQAAHYSQTGEFSADIVVQSSGGSSGRPVLRIPRSPADIDSLYTIVLGAYEKVYPSPARRVALLGGVSHSQAALKFTAGQTRFESFDWREKEALMAFDPDFLSCYPSIGRELLADSSVRLPSLKAIKLGGEPVFPVDVKNLMKRFPEVCVIEQLGSTEMPGMAIGVYRRPEDSRRLELQTQRYEFLLEPHEDWQPLIVRDHFADLLFPIPGPYDTGDDIQLRGREIAAIRRRHDPSNLYDACVDDLLARGCINVQMDPSRAVLNYTGTVDLPCRIRIGDQDFQTRKGGLRRLVGSNKLPLLATGN